MGNTTEEQNLFITATNYLQPYLTGLICFLGIIGNLLNIIVLGQHRMRKCVSSLETTSIFGFIALSISDTLVCLWLLPKIFLPHNMIHFKTYSFSAFYQQYSHAILDIFVMLSTWITVMMGIVRFIISKYPFIAKSYVKSKRFITILILLLPICTACSIPSFLYYTALPFNGSYVVCPTEFSLNKKKKLIYVVFKFLVKFCLPILLMCFCNFQLVKGKLNIFFFFFFFNFLTILLLN